MLDWEICTLGDPLADVGLLMVYWTGPGDDASAWLSPPTTARRLPRPRRAARPLRRGVAAATCADIDFYVAFGYWKLACILEGVYARYVGGALGAGRDPGDFDVFRAQVDQAADQAAAQAAVL